MGIIMGDRSFLSPTDPTLTLYLNPHIVIGATTEPESLAESLLKRFPLKFSLPRYTDQEMLVIVKGMAARMSAAAYTADALSAIAACSKSIPRIAGNLIFQVSDNAKAKI